MKITSEKIFTLQEKWREYMEDSWERGRENIEFIEQSEQYTGDDTKLSFEELCFNFMIKLLRTAQANGKNIELSVDLRSLCDADANEEKVFKRIFYYILLMEHNLESFRRGLDKSYAFGQAVYHIKPVREDQKTLNEVLQIECVEDVTTTFFDRHASRHDFRDGHFCGRSYRIKGKTLRKWYKSLTDVADDTTYNVIDFWFKENKLMEYVAVEGGQYIRKDLVDSLRQSELADRPTKKATCTYITYCRALQHHERFLEKRKMMKFNRLPMVFEAGSVVWADSKDRKKFETYPFGYHLRDTQLLTNYVGSAIADISKSVNADKFFFEPEHVMSQPAMQSAEQINTRSGGMIFTGDISKIRREQPQQIPPEMSALFTQLQATIQSLAGSYFENDSDKIKAVSGVALDKIFKRIDLIQNPVIIAHIEAINEVGRTVKEMIPLYYYQQRNICVTNESGTQEVITINEVEEQPNGVQTIKNDIRNLSTLYEYTIKVSPSEYLQNQNTKLELETIYQMNPQAFTITADLYARSLDIPVAEVLAKRLGATIARPLIEYGDGDITYQEYQQQKEQAQAQQQQQMMSSPDAQYTQARTAKETSQAHAIATQSQIDAFNAQTERMRENSLAQERQTKGFHEGAKLSMENANTQHAQQISLIEKTIEHTVPLKEEPAVEKPRVDD